MMQLDNVIQQNASASEELASMAEELSGQSANLSETMSFFKLGGQEAGAPEPVAVGPRRPETAQVRQSPARGAAMKAKPARLAAKTGITPAGEDLDAGFEEF
jgi:methyl-accepting chemotaxis protein